MTPTVIILDIKERVATLEKELAPALVGTEMTVREAVEIMWQGFHDGVQMDVYIPEMIEAAVESAEIPYEDTARNEIVYGALWSFAESLASKLNFNGFYETTSKQLPHSWNWMPDGRVYLKYDPQIDKYLNSVDD